MLEDEGKEAWKEVRLPTFQEAVDSALANLLLPLCRGTQLKVQMAAPVRVAVVFAEGDHVDILQLCLQECRGRPDKERGINSLTRKKPEILSSVIFL